MIGPAVAVFGGLALIVIGAYLAERVANAAMHYGEDE